MVNNLERIRRLLRDNKEGFIVSEIAKKMDLSRNTARTYIERLIGEGKVNVRKVGPSKLITYKCD